MIHRNTYINGPTVLRDTWQTRARPGSVFRGAGVGCRGLRGVGRVRTHRRPECRAALTLGQRPARAAADDRDWRAWRTTCRTPTRRTISRRTSRSASCRRSRSRRRAGRSAPQPRARARWPIWRRGRARRSPSSHEPMAAASGLRDLSREFLTFLKLQPQRVAAHAARVRHGRQPVSDASRRRRNCAVSELALADFRHRWRPRLSGGAARPRATAARRLRGGSRRCARSRSISFAKNDLPDDPTALVGAPRKERTLPAHLGPDDIDRLLDSAGHGDGCRAGATAPSSSCSTRRDFD